MRLGIFQCSFSCICTPIYIRTTQTRLDRKAKPSTAIVTIPRKIELSPSPLLLPPSLPPFLLSLRTYDVEVKVLSAFSGLVFLHSCESSRFSSGTPTRTVCTVELYTRMCMHVCILGLYRAGSSARRRFAMRPSVPHGRHLGNALTLK